MTLDSSQGTGRHDVILVVDDEEDILESVAQILKISLGDAEVVMAANAQEAMKCLSKGNIDLIISDYRMPGKDGLELLKDAATIAPDVPRILMTAFGDMDVALQAINDARVNSFFRKPFEPEHMVETVWKVLDERWEHLQLQERASRTLESLRGDHWSDSPHKRRNQSDHPPPE